MGHGLQRSVGRSGREQARRPEGPPARCAPSSPSSALHTAPGLGDKGLPASAESHASYHAKLAAPPSTPDRPVEDSGGNTGPGYPAVRHLPRKTIVQASPTSPEWPLSFPGRGGGSGPGVTPQAEAQLDAGGVEWGCCSLWTHPAPHGRLPPLRTDGGQGLTSLQRRGSTEAGQVHKSQPNHR